MSTKTVYVVLKLECKNKPIDRLDGSFYEFNHVDKPADVQSIEYWNASESGFIDASVKANVPQMEKTLRHPNWNRIWGLMNAYASGETQKQYSRVEPLAVLCEVYQLLAEVDVNRRIALPDLAIKKKKGKKAA